MTREQGLYVGANRGADFGKLIEDTVDAHRRKPVSDRALFLAVLAPWFALGFGAIGAAVWWAARH